MLFFYGYFGDDEMINRETCRTSINLRAATSGVYAQNYVPLNCQTKKICITGKVIGKGDCDEFLNVDNVLTRRVSDTEKGINQIEKVYAEETLECWNLMGRGDVSLFSQATAQIFGVGNIHSSCVICSRIAIDEGSFKDIDLNEINVDEYMKTRAVPGSTKSYYQFMLGDDLAPVKIGENLNLPRLEVTETEEGVEETEETDSESVEVNELEYLDGQESAIVFMQISAPGHGSSFLASATAVLGGSAGVFGVRGVLTKGVAAWKFALPLAVIAGVYQQGSVAYNRAAAAAKCSDIKFGSEARSGCSAVRVTNYDLSSISQYCDVIESIP
jgi:hypothetical protein